MLGVGGIQRQEKEVEAVNRVLFRLVILVIKDNSVLDNVSCSKNALLQYEGGIKYNETHGAKIVQRLYFNISKIG